MNTVHLPNLETFSQPASWLNNAGHIDRSACMELRVAALRRMTGTRLDHDKLPGVRPQQRALHHARARSGESYRRRRTCARVLSNEIPAHNRHGRATTAIELISPLQLELIMDPLKPRRLAGDYRDGQSNAMRHHRAWDEELSFHQNRRTHGDRSPGRLLGVTANPNRGATREKITALPNDWYQPIRLERWTFPNRIHPMYYFICPGIHPTQITPDYNLPALHTLGYGHHAHDQDPRLPRLSTCAKGHKKTGCPQRVLFLLLPLASPQEHRDARFAQLWLRSLTAHQRIIHHDFINQLTNRYGLLFHPRTLVCRNCLQVRYGKDPQVMAAWRQKRKAELAAKKAALHNAWVQEAKKKGTPPKPHPEGCGPTPTQPKTRNRSAIS